MKDKRVYEVFGTLAKEETLFTLTDNKLPDSLVFEAIEPFPGFYEDEKGDTMPVYIYLVLNGNYGWDEIIRATQKIRHKYQLIFEAAKAYVTMPQKWYNTVRIRHIKHYDEIPDIQQAFEEEGIMMLYENPISEKEISVIKLIKFFLIEEVINGVYFDDSEPFHGYFEIPGKLDWKEFCEITKNVKYNWELGKFDAALGSIYKGSTLRDVIRIYSTKINLDYLIKCRDSYLDRIQ
ncbi:MAG: hypothetical protein Q8862_08675 [Bacteroidota bacterium]|nr:hypothetical protein [Bacteroidota bacterium]MDP4205100.1 hypothetical protein [Bacteroidota bacterium]